MKRFDVASIERAVVGACLLDPAAYWRIADVLRLDDFFVGANKLVFTAIAELSAANQSRDSMSVTEYLQRHNLLDLVGGSDYVMRMDADAYSSANVRAHAEILSRKAIERRVVDAGAKISKLAGDNVLGDAQRLLAACLPRDNGMVRKAKDFVRESMSGVLERYRSDAAITGLETSFPTLDEMTAGYQPGDVIIVAARPSVGKTAFAVQTAVHAAKLKKSVLFASLEMTGVQLLDRIVAHVAEINPMHLRQPKKLPEEHWGRLTTAKVAIDGLPLYIDETPSLTIEALGARARQLHAQQLDSEEPLGLIVIDYLQYMQLPRAESVAEAIQIVTRSLKSLAKELRVPIILLSQLNRDGDERPTLKNLRGSGAIEQDADVVVILHRPDKKRREIVLADVAKQRNGPVGEVYLEALMDRMRFNETDYEPAKAEAPSRGMFDERDAAPRRTRGSVSADRRAMEQ